MTSIQLNPNHAQPKLTEYGLAIYWDEANVRIAIHDARKMIAEGRAPDKAATLACSGAWAEWRDWVLNWLLNGANTEQFC